MNMRQAIQDRSVALDRAQALLDLIAAEEREFTEAEQIEFDACVTNATDLGGKIETAQAQRDTVRLLAEKKYSSNDAEKPSPEDKSKEPKTMKRAEWNALHSTAKADFVRNGGSIIE